MRVDADLWLCVLDLAAVSGWKPEGTAPPSGANDEPGNPYAYHLPDGRRVSTADAEALARTLEQALPGVSDDQLPLRGNSFGEENTLDLIARAAGGGTVALEDAAGALEILSGPPKSEAFELVEFLRGGAFAIHANERALSKVSDRASP